MNTSHSHLIALFNFCLIAILLAACVPATPSLTATVAPFTEPTASAAAPSPAPAESAPTEGRVVIRWLADSFGRRPDLTLEGALNAPDDDIELDLMYEVFHRDWLSAQLGKRARNEGGDLPDLIGPYSPGMLYNYTDQWLDLSPYLDSDELTGFDPKALRGWQDEDGQMLGLPVKLHPSVIFYNRAMFDAAGLTYPPHRLGEPYADGEAWTIEKMESLAIQLTLDGQGRTPASPDFDPADVKQYGLSHFSTCVGPIATLFGNLQPSIAADGKILLTDPWKEAMRWFYAAMWEKHFIPPLNADHQWKFLDSGQAAMVYAPTWYLSTIETQQTWDLAAVPSHDGQINSYTDMDGVAALSTTKHPREAARALLYLASVPELHSPEELSPARGLPARPEFQPQYLAELDAQYPQGVDWQVTIDSLLYSQYADYNYPNNPLCQDEFMDRLSETPGLDLEAEFDQLTVDP